MARLSASNAVAALLVTEHGHYLLQLRDEKPGIWYPGHWGLFGGAVEDGETADEALRRELTEEIQYAPERVARFTSFTFDLGFVGQGTVYRAFYEVLFAAERIRSLVLGEGSALRLFTPGEVLALPRVVPYDAFALWLHINRSRLA